MIYRQLDFDILQERFYVTRDGDVEIVGLPVTNDERVEEHFADPDAPALRRTNIVLEVQEFEW